MSMLLENDFTPIRLPLPILSFCLSGDVSIIEIDERCKTFISVESLDHSSTHAAWAYLDYQDFRSLAAARPDQIELPSRKGGGASGQRLTGDDVVKVLERVTAERGKPQTIRVDNGPDFISTSLDLWAYFNGVKLDFSRRGKPTDNAFIESFNGRLREECLNQHWFTRWTKRRG